jgi:hypothetical protein
VQEALVRIDRADVPDRMKEFDNWCVEMRANVEKDRTGVPGFIFDLENNSAQFFFERFRKYFFACEQLNELQRYIELLANECNNVLRNNPNESPEIVIQNWLNTLSKSNCPRFLQAEDKFFERFIKYYIDILRIEAYVEHKAKSQTATDVYFTNQLLNLSRYENTTAICLLVPKIIDELADGSHAEIRLFYYLDQILQRNIIDIPYFGITQLCCANCRTFLSGRGLTHESGHRHHAGMHGKHYPDWVFDEKLCTEPNLRALFGPAYDQYVALVGEYTVDGETKTLKEWARVIVQELGVLTEKLMEQFGIPGKPLFLQSSNYADEDFVSPFSRWANATPEQHRAANIIKAMFRIYKAKKEEAATMSVNSRLTHS